MLRGPTGVGTLKKPGLSLLGLFMLPAYTLDSQEIGGEEKPPFFQSLGLPQSYLPILA